MNKMRGNPRPMRAESITSGNSVSSNGYLEVAKEILERRGYQTQIKKEHLQLIGGDAFAAGKISSAKTSLENNEQHCYIIRLFEDIGLRIKLHEGNLVVY